MPTLDEHNKCIDEYNKCIDACLSEMQCITVEFFGCDTAEDCEKHAQYLRSKLVSLWLSSQRALAQVLTQTRMGTQAWEQCRRREVDLEQGIKRLEDFIRQRCEEFKTILGLFDEASTAVSLLSQQFEKAAAEVVNLDVIIEQIEIECRPKLESDALKKQKQKWYEGYDLMQARKKKHDDIKSCILLLDKSKKKLIAGDISEVMSYWPSDSLLNSGLECSKAYSKVDVVMRRFSTFAPPQKFTQRPRKAIEEERKSQVLSDMNIQPVTRVISQKVAQEVVVDTKALRSELSEKSNEILKNIAKIKVNTDACSSEEAMMAQRTQCLEQLHLIDASDEVRKIQATAMGSQAENEYAEKLSIQTKEAVHKKRSEIKEAFRSRADQLGLKSEFWREQRQTTVSPKQGFFRNAPKGNSSASGQQGKTEENFSSLINKLDASLKRLRKMFSLSDFKYRLAADVVYNELVRLRQPLGQQGTANFSNEQLKPSLLAIREFSRQCQAILTRSAYKVKESDTNYKIYEALRTLRDYWSYGDTLQQFFLDLLNVLFAPFALILYMTLEQFRLFKITSQGETLVSDLNSVAARLGNCQSIAPRQ